MKKLMHILTLLFCLASFQSVAQTYSKNVLAPKAKILVRFMDKNHYQPHSSNHTKEEVDAYNDAVKAMNNSVNKANATNNFLNENRTNLFNNWNEAIQSYFDDQMPVYKRR